MAFLNAYIEDLRELVNLDAGTGNPAGVTRAAKIMQRHYKDLGWSADLVDLGDAVGNGLLVRNKPDADHYDILFNAHLDTVFPDGTAAARPFSIEGFHANGPGCADCKAGVLSILYAMKFADPKDLERLSICIAYNPDEETGSLYSKEWLLELATASKRALVCEGARAGGELVRSRKGISIYTVKFIGRSAHAGNNPQDGCSAVLAAARFVLEADKLNDYERGITLSAGVIRGGTVSNVIPDNAYVEYDARYWKDEDQIELREKLRALAEQSWGDGVVTTFEQNTFKPAMPLSDATKDLVDLIDQAAQLAGFDATWVDAGGASDGNQMAKNGTPVVDGCGPAGGSFHTEREFLRLDTVEERTLMLKNLLSLI